MICIRCSGCASCMLAACQTLLQRPHNSLICQGKNGEGGAHMVKVVKCVGGCGVGGRSPPEACKVDEDVCASVCLDSRRSTAYKQHLHWNGSTCVYSPGHCPLAGGRQRCPRQQHLIPTLLVVLLGVTWLDEHATLIWEGCFMQCTLSKFADCFTMATACLHIVQSCSQADRTKKMLVINAG